MDKDVKFQFLQVKSSFTKTTSENFHKIFWKTPVMELQRATLDRNCLTTSILLGVLSNFQGIFWQLFLNAKTWPMIHRDVQQDTIIHGSNFHFDNIYLYTF